MSILVLLALAVGVSAAEKRVLRERATLKRHMRNVVALAFSRDGKTLASASEDGTVRLWDLATGKHTATIFRAEPKSLSFSADGKTLALGGHGDVTLWDVATGKKVAALKGIYHGVYSVAYSPDGKLLVAAGHSLLKEPKIKAWDAKTWKELPPFKDAHTDVNTVTFSPDGKALASSDSSGDKVRLWDVTTRKELAAFGVQSNRLRSIAFSPDGKTLAATGGKDNAVVLWDVAARKERKAIKGVSSEVGLAFSVDGKALVSVNEYSGEFRVWEVATGKEQARYSTYETFSVIARSPDGKTVATGCADNTIRLWDVPPSDKAVVIRATPGPRKKPPAGLDKVVEAEIKEAVTDLFGAFVAGRMGKLAVVEKAQVVYVDGTQVGKKPKVWSVKQCAELMLLNRYIRKDKVDIEVEVDQAGPGLVVARVKLPKTEYVVVYQAGGQGDCIKHRCVMGGLRHPPEARVP